LIQDNEFICDVCYKTFDKLYRIPTDGGQFCEDCHEELDRCEI